jgi:hypothetical protein
VTAVTTAGLLAGLFGSAFVPAARAANDAEDATQTITVTNADRDTATVEYFKSSDYPAFTVLIAPDDATFDDSTYGISVSGGTIRTCTIAVSTDADDPDDTTVSVITKTTTTCDSTVDFGDAVDRVTWTVTLNKLAAGATATVTLSDDSGTQAPAAGDVGKFTGVASTAASDDISASESQDTFGLDIDFDEDSDADDDADTVISNKAYFLPDSIPHYSGSVMNGYGLALNATATDPNLIIEVTGDVTVGCETNGVAAAVADSEESLVAITQDIDTDEHYACSVYNQDDENTHSYTITVKTAGGLLIGSATGYFLGDVASATISLEASIVASDLDDDLADFVFLTMKDAAGNTYPLDEAQNYTVTAEATLDGDDVATFTVTETDGAGGGAALLDDGAYEFDDAVCGEGDQELKGTLTFMVENLAEEDVETNTVSFECGADFDDALFIDSIVLETKSPAPAEVFEVWFYMVDVDGVKAGYGAVQDENPVTIIGLTSSDTNYVAADEEFDCDVLANGYCVIDFKASSTVGTAISVEDTDGEALATGVVSTNMEGTLSKGKKSGRVIATFASAPRQVIKFEVENANTGVVRTYSRRASATGVGRLDIARRGTFYVTAYLATDDTSLTDTLTIRR